MSFDASHLLDTVAGIAAAAGRQWTVAEDHYPAALRLADHMPFIGEQADARYWYACMLLDRATPEDRRHAHELLGKALAIYKKLGMPWHVTRAEGLVSTARG